MAEWEKVVVLQNDFVLHLLFSDFCQIGKIEFHGRMKWIQ